MIRDSSEVLLRLGEPPTRSVHGKLALRVGAHCAASGSPDAVDVSVALCARDRDHPVITSDPDDIRAIEFDL